MTEPLIDLKALLVEREDFEGSMVSKLREGLAQGPQQIKALKEIHDTLSKRIAVAAGPQQKKLQLKMGVVQFYQGDMNAAVDSLKQSDGPLAAFFLGGWMAGGSLLAILVAIHVLRVDEAARAGRVPSRQGRPRRVAVPLSDRSTAGTAATAAQSSAAEEG